LHPVSTQEQIRRVGVLIDETRAVGDHCGAMFVPRPLVTAAMVAFDGLPLIRGDIQLASP